MLASGSILAAGQSPAPVSGPSSGPVSPVNDEPVSVPAIQYPDDAKKARIQGSVELEVSVDATGEVTNVRALSGPVPLRQAAIDAYFHAIYRPLMKDGRPAPAVIETAVNFKLNELPPDTDLLVEQQFKPLQARCQQLSIKHDADAQEVCQKVVDLGRRFSPKTQLEARGNGL